VVLIAAIFSPDSNPDCVLAPNLQVQNIRYVFVTENSLTLCEPNFMIGPGSDPAGAWKQKASVAEA
jgi:hypothetical protein